MESAAWFGRARVTFKLLKKGRREEVSIFNRTMGGAVLHNRHTRIHISNNYPTSAGGDSGLIV